MLASTALMLLALLTPPAAQAGHEEHGADHQDDAAQEDEAGHGDDQAHEDDPAQGDEGDADHEDDADHEAEEDLEAGPSSASIVEVWRLDAATNVICDVLFRRRPWLARELGRDSHDCALGPYDALEKAAWENTMGDARRQLARVQDALLPPDRLPDLLWLRALLDAEALARGALPSPREDPGIYVRHAAGSLEAALQARGLPAGELAAAVRLWLEGLPALTTAARRNLRDTIAPWTEFALEDLADLEQLTSVVVASVVRNPGLTEEELEQGEAALELGLAALRDYRIYLSETVLPVGRASFSMNSASWRGTMQRLTGADVEFDALELRLLRDLGRLDRALGGVARTRGSRTASAESADLLVADVITSLAGIAAQVGLAVPRGRKFLVISKAPGRGFQPVATWQRGALAPGVLVLGTPSPLWPRALYRQRQAEFGRLALFALAVRYGPLGEGGLRMRNALSLLPARIALENFPLRQGFGLYATDWVLRVPRVASAVSEEARGELQRQRFGAALQLYATLLLHGRQEPFEEVVETWALHTGDDLETARRTVLLMSRDPFAGAGYLSYLELLRLERALRGDDPDWVAALRTLDLVARNPSGRPVDLLEHLEVLAPALVPGH